MITPACIPSIPMPLYRFVDLMRTVRNYPVDFQIGMELSTTTTDTTNGRRGTQQYLSQQSQKKTKRLQFLCDTCRCIDKFFASWYDNYSPLGKKSHWTEATNSCPRGQDMAALNKSISIFSSSKIIFLLEISLFALTYDQVHPVQAVGEATILFQ